MKNNNKNIKITCCECIYYIHTKDDAPKCCKFSHYVLSYETCSAAKK